jgi:predicted ATPase
LNEVELEPLDKDSTAALAASVAQRELASDEIECLYRETEGNPLFVVETVRMGLSAQDQEPDIPAGARGAACLPRPLPAQMQAAIEGRLAQLSGPARELAELSATIGREFTFAVLRQATEMVEDTLVRALDELWRRRIVREQGADAYDFDHDKLREVAYASTSTARRHLLHRRVAQALEAVHQGNLDPVSAQVAAHYQRAGQPQRAIPYYQRAAQVARRVCANQEAKRHLQQALSLLEATPPTRAIDQWRRETLEVLHTSLGEVEELISQQCPTPGQDDKTRAEE